MLYEFFLKADPLDQASLARSYSQFPFTHLGLFSLADESSEGEEKRVTTKEEDEVDWVRSWVEVGGLPALAEEEA